MQTDTITSIDEYTSIMQPLMDKGCIAFRGQCCASWSLEPGIIRKIKNTYEGIEESGLLFSLSVDNTCELLAKARRNENINNSDCDLNILAILQHFGAATPLLDFTYDPLVALYFACQPYEQNQMEEDGTVFCLNYPNQMKSTASPMRPVDDPSAIIIKDALGPEHPGIWYWKPPDALPCKRSEKQQSVFMFGWLLYWKYNTDCLVEGLTTVRISVDRKQQILADLDERHDISEVSLFPDIHGFAQANSREKIIRHFSAEEFYQKGQDYYWDGSPEWAAEYYRMAFTKKPNWVEARCQCARSIDQLGEQTEAIGLMDKSIEDVGENWQFFACRAKFKYKIGCEWQADLNKAKVLAEEVNESNQCKSFIDDLGI
ncbi:FRG domain-containing protein [Planctomycetota bacterium]